jgi:hypothetical protein
MRVAVLYQAGYLTIVDYNDQFGEYILDYPNEEVRSAFANALLERRRKDEFGFPKAVYSGLYSSKIKKIEGESASAGNEEEYRNLADKLSIALSGNIYETI